MAKRKRKSKNTFHVNHKSSWSRWWVLFFFSVVVHSFLPSFVRSFSILILSAESNSVCRQRHLFISARIDVYCTNMLIKCVFPPCRCSAILAHWTSCVLELVCARAFIWTHTRNRSMPLWPSMTATTTATTFLHYYKNRKWNRNSKSRR